MTPKSARWTEKTIPEKKTKSPVAAAFPSRSKGGNVHDPNRVPFVRSTMSFPAEVSAAGKARARQFRLNFSEYVSRLIEEDVASKRTVIPITPFPPAR